MKEIEYFMPTRVYFDKDIIIKSEEVIKKYGNKAFIITGKSSSKKNGSLDDIISLLDKTSIDYCIFDDIEENPSLGTVERASIIGRQEKVDFIIGIGGGSPIDTAKAVGVLIKNQEARIDDLFSQIQLLSIPIIAVPTTAGTGTEVTPYAIFTDHRLQTKRNFSQKVFPDVAFLDAKYLVDTPEEITVNTAVDALSHLIEGYLSARSNILSDAAAEKGLVLFTECIENLKNREFTYEVREKLLVISTLAGMVIAQSGTSLPHGMGYALTYFKGIPHGKANGLLLKEYLKLSLNMDKAKNIIQLLNFNTVEEFGELMNNLIVKESNITEEELVSYTESMISNREKLKNHPAQVSKEELLNIYINSLL